MYDILQQTYVYYGQNKAGNSVWQNSCIFHPLLTPDFQYRELTCYNRVVHEKTYIFIYKMVV